MNDFLDNYTFVTKKEYKDLHEKDFALHFLFGYLKSCKNHKDNITIQEVLDLINETLEERGIDRLG